MNYAKAKLGQLNAIARQKAICADAGHLWIKKHRRTWQCKKCRRYVETSGDEYPDQYPQ